MFSEYSLRNGTVRIGETLAFTYIASDAKFVNAAFAFRPKVAIPHVAGGGSGRRGKEGGRELGLNSAIYYVHRGLPCLRGCIAVGCVKRVHVCQSFGAFRSRRDSKDT